MNKTIQLQENKQGIRLLMLGTFPLLEESWMQSKKNDIKSEKRLTSNKITPQVD